MIFKNAMVFVGGYNISGSMNLVSLDHHVESMDDTRFGQNTRTKIGGLTVALARGQGFWSASTGSIDEMLFAGLGVDDAIATLFPDGITEGGGPNGLAGGDTGLGYAFKVTESDYRFGGAVGINLPFTFQIQGRGVLP